MADEVEYFYDDYVTYKSLYDKEYKLMLRSIRAKHKIKLKIQVMELAVDEATIKAAAIYFKLGSQQYCIGYYPSVNYWCLHQQVNKNDYDSVCELDFDLVTESVLALIEDYEIAQAEQAEKEANEGPTD